MDRPLVDEEKKSPSAPLDSAARRSDTRRAASPQKIIGLAVYWCITLTRAQRPHLVLSTVELPKVGQTPMSLRPFHDHEEELVVKGRMTALEGHSPLSS